MAKNYYDILGISKNASQDDIKRAYRRAAHQHHPDKGGDQQKFKEINEAYQILGSEQKRRQYDQFGDAGFSQGFGNTGGFAGGGWDDIFSSGFARSDSNSGFEFSFGGLGDVFGDVFENAFSQIQSEVEIPLTSALLGGKINLRHQNGEEINLEIPAGTQDGASFRLRGKGGQTRRGRGDLILTVRIKMPRRISRRQKELLEELKKEGL